MPPLTSGRSALGNMCTSAAVPGPCRNGQQRVDEHQRECKTDTIGLFLQKRSRAVNLSVPNLVL